MSPKTQIEDMIYLNFRRDLHTKALMHIKWGIMVNFEIQEEIKMELIWTILREDLKALR